MPAPSPPLPMVSPGAAIARSACAVFPTGCGERIAELVSLPVAEFAMPEEFWCQNWLPTEASPVDVP